MSDFKLLKGLALWLSLIALQLHDCLACEKSTQPASAFVRAHCSSGFTQARKLNGASRKNRNAGVTGHMRVEVEQLDAALRNGELLPCARDFWLPESHPLRRLRALNHGDG